MGINLDREIKFSIETVEEEIGSLLCSGLLPSYRSL